MRAQVCAGGQISGVLGQTRANSDQIWALKWTRAGKLYACKGGLNAGKVKSGIILNLYAGGKR